TEGLKYAFEHGHVRRINMAGIYEMKDIFTGYVDFIHELRLVYKEDKNEVFELLSKYMHNSLYGKFAQLDIITEKEALLDDDEYSREIIFNLVTGHSTIITRLMNTEITQRMEGEGKNSNVAIASHITENARFYLWEIMKTVGIEKILYCDTDSIKLRVVDLDRKKIRTSRTILGALKVVSKDKSNPHGSGDR
ncbi:unnamed protein product, partial [marine sediment metagenome]